MAHTKGPWKFIEGDRERRAMSDIVRDDQEDFRIGYVLCEWSSNPARQEDIANGRLIAAAPELLNALLVLTLDPRIANWLDNNDPKALEQANAAIAKANGK